MPSWRRCWISPGRTLTLTTKASSELVRVGAGGGPTLLVELSDEGSGIPPEVQQKLFTPFFTTKPQGSGLGLAISHKIIEEHGGRLVMKSLVGQGTTGRVYLPVHPAATDEPLRDERAWRTNVF